MIPTITRMPPRLIPPMRVSRETMLAPSAGVGSPTRVWARRNPGLPVPGLKLPGDVDADEALRRLGRLTEEQRAAVIGALARLGPEDYPP